MLAINHVTCHARTLLFEFDYKAKNVILIENIVNEFGNSHGKRNFTCSDKRKNS